MRIFYMGWMMGFSIVVVWYLTHISQVLDKLVSR